ncbi:MAG TPA: DUF1853 family protein [Flavobacteriales bacterium]
MLKAGDFSFRNPEVADLAWAIASAPLMSNDDSYSDLQMVGEEWCLSQLEAHNLWLRDLDDNPSALLDFLNAEGLKLLGKKFESLLAFWFSHSPVFELLHRNVVLHDDAKNTSGEIDFIIRDVETNELMHIESACKYYIGYQKSSHWDNWIGPNGHDSLDNKLKKSQRQLRAFERKEGRAFLKAHELEMPRSYLFMKGYFFHHYSRLEGAVPPKHAHPHYNGGWYIYEHELPLFKGDYAQWMLLPKQRWIGTYQSHEEQDVFSGSEMIDACRQFIRRHAKAPMIIQVEERDGLTVEVSRGFVVRDAWPHF